MIMRQKDRQYGFTLVELLVTIAIIAVLAGVAVPFSEIAIQRSKEDELHSALREIRQAIDAYKLAVDEGRIQHSINESGYPKTLHNLVEGIEDSKDLAHKKIYFLRRIPRDPFFPNKQAPDEQTWGKRSYASPPDNPRAGDDIFDIYSLSAETGLNNIPYRQW